MAFSLYRLSVSFSFHSFVCTLALPLTLVPLSPIHSHTPLRHPLPETTPYNWFRMTTTNSSAINQVLSHLSEDTRGAAFEAMRNEFAQLATASTMSSPSSSSSQSQQVHATANAAVAPTTRVKPQAPEAFKGDRTKVDQFLIQLRRYLVLADLTTISDARQVEYAAQYLTAEALVWFENVQKTDSPITTLIELDTKLRAHFQPYGAEKIARTKLRQLQQTHTVQGYSTIFMQTVQHVPSMHVDDQIEAYVQGLKPSIFREVVLKDLKSLQEVMDFAVFVESRLQHRIYRADRVGFTPFASRSSTAPPSAAGGSSSSSSSSSSVPMDLSVADEVDLHAVMNGQVLKKLTDAERDQLRRQGKCFRCRQIGHISRDCPKSSKNGMAQH